MSSLSYTSSYFDPEYWATHYKLNIYYIVIEFVNLKPKNNKNK